MATVITNDTTELATRLEAMKKERILERHVSHGRKLWLHPMLYTYKLAIGQADSYSFDDVWCYATFAEGEKAFNEWNPDETKEPTGWIRHPRTGRFRPDADPAREYVKQ